MNKVYSFLCVLTLLTGLTTFSSCLFDKDDDPTPLPTPLSERGKLLTDSIWSYYEYYNNYQTNNTRLVWKANRTSNELDLHLNKVKFEKDGSYWEINETGDSVKGTWEFSDNESRVTVKTSTTEVFDIRVLNSNVFEWEVAGGTSYGIMMKQFPVSNRAKTIAQLLSGKKWVYQRYFYDYSLPNAQLIWRFGKPNNNYPQLDSLFQEYFPDGTVIESYKDGTTVLGKWAASSNGTNFSVTPVGGLTFTSEIKVMNDSVFEWSRVDRAGYYYGVLVRAGSAGTTPFGSRRAKN